VVRVDVGHRIGRYEIVERIGSGGMGEVYRARDTLLDKTVAIKIIASDFVDDPAAGPRFERERTLSAALEHPHVCRLLDAGQDCGVSYLAMEYLDGESLARRLARGSIRRREALGYAIELADALSYAHSRGVIHRDLKPANVHLSSTGIKVLDFGLAKLRPVTPAANPQADTARLQTTPGTLIGTALYMPPERLAGMEADHRSDVFSFGLVVYEMLAGRRAFHGDSMASLIADIMTADPPRLQLSEEPYEEFEWVIRRCLEKKPDDRWQSMHDVALILRRLGRGEAAPRRQAISRRALAGAAIAAAMVFAGIAVWLPSRGPVDATPLTFNVEPPPGGGFTPTANSVQSPMLAASPDGSSLAYVASGPDGAPQVWVRRFASVPAQPLRGTDDAMFPFWSPDSQSLGFFSRGELKRIDLAGGPPRSLAPAPAPCGGAWSASGVIVFAPLVTGGLKQVPAQGGDVTAASSVDPSLGHTSHRWPRFVGSGSSYLFFARGGQRAGEGIYLGSLEGGSPKLVVRSGFAGEFVPPNQLVYLSDGSLVAQTFDDSTGRISGDPVLLAENVGWSSNYYPAFSVSATGALAYASAAHASELTWFDRSGQTLGKIGGPAAFVDFRLSPDNQHVAVAQTDPRTGRPDLYVFDLKKSTSDRLTSEPASDGTPTWSPDGRALLFRSNREAVHDLYLRGVFDMMPERPFLKSDAAKYPTSWSHDGTILFHSPGVSTGWDVWEAAADGSRQPKPVIQTRFNEAQAQLSPDGRWIAYAADEGSSVDVYVQRFPLDGRRWRISLAGGSDPRWNANGSELLFLSADQWLTSVGVRSHAELQVLPPKRLFKLAAPAVQAPYTSLYDVTSDGTKLLVRVPREDLRSVPLTVVLNGPALESARAR
jgi:Tol biopolymer transport system component